MPIKSINLSGWACLCAFNLFIAELEIVQCANKVNSMLFKYIFSQIFSTIELAK